MAVVLAGTFAVQAGASSSVRQAAAVFNPGTVDVQNSQQVVVVRSQGWGAPYTDVTVEALEWDKVGWKSVVGPVNGHIGRNGFSLSHREGDGTTPAGVYTLTEAFGRVDPPAGMKLGWKSVAPNSWWVSDPDSPSYNTWQEGPSNGLWREAFGERLSASGFVKAYRQAVVIDYNRAPVEKYKGSAIFMHVDTGKPTSGCVSLSEDPLKKIMTWLDPALSPRIVLGPDNWLLEPTRPVAPDLAPAVGLTTVTPQRLVDTRVGLGARTGKIDSNSSIEVQVRGRAGVPADADVVILNLTATEPTHLTYLRVTPSGASVPDNAVSNLNVHAGAERANLVFARIGTSGMIRIFNASGQVHTVADVVGYGSSQLRGGYSPVPPRRILDTRTGRGMANEADVKLGPGTVLDLQLGGVLKGATAAIVNITGTDATEPTYLSAFAGGEPWPGTSTLNLRPGATVPNLAIVPMSADGTIRVRNSSGSANVIIDLFGYVTPNAGSRYQPAIQPTRLVDTRTGLGSRGQLASGASMPLELPGAPSGVTGVAFNLTGANASNSTYVAALPAGYKPSEGSFSNLNVEQSTPTANLILIQTTAERGIDVFNASGTIDLIADVQGWFVT